MRGARLTVPGVLLFAFCAGLLAPVSARAAGNAGIAFDFDGTDIRLVAAQILGTILHVNYTIDPAVSGTVTLHTVTPLGRAAMLPTLETLLAENNALLVRTGGVYRVEVAQAPPVLTNAGAIGGAMVLALRYASAPQLAAMLQPYAGNNGAIIAEPGSNAVILQGDTASQLALAALVRAFDVDALAGQSYEMFPVGNGNMGDFVTGFKAALVAHGGAASAVSVVGLERVGAVLVIARSRNDLAEAARVYGVLGQVRNENLRSWHAVFLRNSRANDAAYVLQQAFTPGEVTAQPTAASAVAAGTAPSGDENQVGGLLGASVLSGGDANAASSSTGNSGGGPLPASASGEPSGIQITPDLQNNSLLIYADAAEDGAIEGMLSKIDILPVEVRVDATIAEVDLNGKLQYGTQFFFKSGGINAALSEGSNAALAGNFPGFVLAGHGADAAPLAISLLQSATKLRVLSSPELTVLDGQAASLQAGNLVPYLTQTSQDVTAGNAPVISTVDYRETGVILRVTPHVGGDGLVTLDVAQEISAVAPGFTTSGIKSPTFTDRAVTSRVAIQDGQTVGFAGLISDDDSHGNSGIPFLKNIPVLGSLFGTQNNSRDRQELLVLITPHVIRGQQQALDLTEDMRQELPDAAGVEAALRNAPAGGQP